MPPELGSGRKKEEERGSGSAQRGEVHCRDIIQDGVTRVPGEARDNFFFSASKNLEGPRSDTGTVLRGQDNSSPYAVASLENRNPCQSTVYAYVYELELN